MKINLEIFKNNLAKYNRKKIINFLIFFFISFCLWFILALNKNYVDSVKIKIRYYNIPENIVIVSNLPDYLNVKISAAGIKILAYQLNIKKAVLNINLNNLFQKQEDSLTISEDKLLYFAKDALNDVNVFSIKPNEIVIKYSSLKMKFLKIVPLFEDLNSSFEPQYGLSGNIIVVPEKIEVYGPSNIIDTLNYIYTDIIKLKNLKDTAIIKVRLQIIKDIKISNIEENVKVIIPVDRIIETKVIKDIKIINLPENYNLQLFPSYVIISFKIPMCLYKGGDNIMLQPYVDFNELNNDKEYLNVYLKDTIPFSKEILVNPDKVEFIIRKK